MGRSRIVKEAATEIEKQVELVNNAELSAYVNLVGNRLAAQPKAAGYPYTFKVINDPSINAFALPGGPTFVNTGLISAVDNEAQLAGVLAHEISHVALRHGQRRRSMEQCHRRGRRLVHWDVRRASSS